MSPFTAIGEEIWGDLTSFLWTHFFLDTMFRGCKPVFVSRILLNRFCLLSEKIKYLTMIDASKVWMPDSFFRNEKLGRFHKMLMPNLYIRIFPNGDVLYSIRLECNIKSPFRI